MDGKDSGYQLFSQNCSDSLYSMERERREWYIQEMWR